MSKKNNMITRLGQFMFEDGTHVPAGLPYHIHPDNGAMEGAEHNPDIPGGQLGHRFLIPSNKPVDKMSLPINTIYYDNHENRVIYNVDFNIKSFQFRLVNNN